MNDLMSIFPPNSSFMAIAMGYSMDTCILGSFKDKINFHNFVPVWVFGGWLKE